MTDSTNAEQHSPADSSAETGSAAVEADEKDVEALPEDPLTRAIINQNLSDLQSIASIHENLDWNETLPNSIYTPLLLAVQTKAPLSLIRTMLEHTPQNPSLKIQVDTTSPRAGGFTPLMVACHLQQYDVAALLLHHGARVNAFAQGSRRTALMVAAGQNHVPLTKLLLDHGANCLQYDEQAKSAFVYACSNNALDTVQLMARHYQEPNNQYSISYLVNHSKVDPPLWYASAMGHVQVVQFLLDHGATVEYRRQDATIYSTTPLMESCEWGHLEVVQVLLQHGADPCNKTGRKALKLARESGYHSVVSCMEAWQERLGHIQNLLAQPQDLRSLDLSVWAKLLAKTGKRPGIVNQLLQQLLERPDAMALFTLNNSSSSSSTRQPLSKKGAAGPRQMPNMMLPGMLFLMTVVMGAVSNVATASSWQGHQPRAYHGFDRRSRNAQKRPTERHVIDDVTWREEVMESWGDATSSSASTGLDKESEESKEENWDFLTFQTDESTQTQESLDKSFGSSTIWASSDQEQEERILLALQNEETQQTDTHEGETVKFQQEASSRKAMRPKREGPRKRQAHSQQPSLSNKTSCSPTSPSGNEKESVKTLQQKAKSSPSAAKAKPGKSDSKADLSSVANPWVQLFLTQNTGEKLMLVPLDFLLDNFNLAQLAPVVETIVHKTLYHQNLPPDATSYPFYKRGLQLLTNPDPFSILQPNESQSTEMGTSTVSGSSDPLDRQAVELAAVVLYCLVHQRYVLSPRGHEALWRRFLLQSPPGTSQQHVQALFGRCPRTNCRGMPLLPAGHDDYLVVDQPQDKIEDYIPPLSFRYCGHCQTYWNHWKDSKESSSPTGRFIQGCAWGRSLGPLFLLSYPNFLKPKLAFDNLTLGVPSEPHIFGFRIHPSALSPS